MKKFVVVALTLTALSSFAAERTVKVCETKEGSQEVCTVVDSSTEGAKAKVPGLLNWISDLAAKYNINLCSGGCVPYGNGIDGK